MPSSIAAGNGHFQMRGGFLVRIPDQRLLRYFGSDNDIIISNEYLIFGKYCVAGCPNLTSISFADGSRLKEIEHCAIFNTELSSFQIPASVERINGSAFGACTTRTLRVEDGNLHFQIEGDFLLDSAGHELIRYFGGSSVVCIDERIDVLGTGCFHGHPHVVRCDFCTGSRLRSVKAGAFWKCPIGISICPGVFGMLSGRHFRVRAIFQSRTCHQRNSVFSVSGNGSTGQMHQSYLISRLQAG
jgi:hypothetical protein